MKRHLQILALGAMTAILAGTAFAAPLTFAQYTSSAGANDFLFTNFGTHATFTTIAGGAPVKFNYNPANILGGGLPAALLGQQDAHLTMNQYTNVPFIPLPAGPGQVNLQPMNTTGAGPCPGCLPPNTNIMTIHITRDTPYLGLSNLLTIFFEDAFISGFKGGNSANESATTSAALPLHVTFSSDFLNFTGTVDRDLALAFTALTPAYGDFGAFLASFAAASAGSFASDPPPTFVPEPLSLVLIGSGLLGVSLLRRRATKA